jgi:hypothetical protein
VTTGGAFYRQGLFVGSGGSYAPVPRPPHRLRCVRQPLDDALTSSRALAGPSLLPKYSGSGEGRHTSDPFTDEVSDTLVPEASPARPPFTLTATLFGALRESLFEARMLLADFCNEYDVRT